MRCGGLAGIEQKANHLNFIFCPYTSSSASMYLHLSGSQRECHVACYFLSVKTYSNEPHYLKKQTKLIYSQKTSMSSLEHSLNSLTHFNQAQERWNECSIQSFLNDPPLAIVWRSVLMIPYQLPYNVSKAGGNDVATP